MSDFKNKSITTKGLELLSKAMTGGKLEFTRIEMGSGTFSGDVTNAENLIEVKQNLSITNIVRKGGQVTLSAILKVEDITTEYDWTEIGVYAKGADEVEVLYMYGYTTNTSFISKDSLNEKLINVTVIVSGASNVTAIIDGSIMYLTQEALEDHNNSELAHNDIRELINELKVEIEGLDVSWEGITGKPESFPASDVYAWAKASTKPTYTASEVGALASGGTAVNASKVANALTISLNGTSQGAYNGSAAKSINITATSVGAAASSHTHSASNISAGTFTGAVVAQTNASYTTRQVRNVFESTASPSGGGNGDIWFKYV